MEPKLFELIPQVDISSLQKQIDFKLWQHEDGSVVGLKELIKKQKENNIES